MSPHFPHFIEDKVVYSCNLVLSKKYRSKLALLRNLQFYEVRNKQILNEFDLQNTVLTKILHKVDSLEFEINGKLASQATDIFPSSSKISPNQNHKVGDIMIGKYIHQKKTDTIVYLLIKCWNTMVVIKRDPQGFSLQAEYEYVSSFQLSKESNYRTKVTISFLSSEHLETTDFQKENHSSSLPIDSPTAEIYKKMIDKIKIKKSELLVHQTLTRKEFGKLKNVQIFGCNNIRTPRSEELQILSKCGNTWIKVTANDNVVIGVPIVNNSSSRLIVLRNFRAVLLSIENTMYTFKLYHLNEPFCGMKSFENFFNESECNENNSFKDSWDECSDLNLRPEGFYILVLNLRINEQFYERDHQNIPLFAFYNITSSRTFNQKCFLTSLTLKDCIFNEQCRLHFNEDNLHRDLLTVMASSFKTTIRLEYVVTGVSFETFLSQKLGFVRAVIKENMSEPMQIDESEEDDEARNVLRKLVFFNKNQNSCWHGTLLEITHINSSTADVKIFTKSYKKSKILITQLQLDLKAYLGLKDVQENLKTFSTKLIEFEAALRDECSSCLETYSNSAMRKDRMNFDKKKELHRQLHLKQFQTDWVFKNLFC